MVAVMLADAVAKFARATPITNSTLLSYGSVIVEGNWVCRGTVPSETGLFGLLVRKIAKPLTGGPVLLTSAHPTTVDANWPVVISKVAFGFIVAPTDAVMIACV